MKPPRGLSAAEAALWKRVTDTVRPLVPPRNGEGDHAKHGGGGSPHAPWQEANPLRQPLARLPPPRAG